MLQRVILDIRNSVFDFRCARIITTDTFSPELAFRLIPRYKVSFVLNGVHQMVLMVKEKYACMHIISWATTITQKPPNKHLMPASF